MALLRGGALVDDVWLEASLSDGLRDHGLYPLDGAADVAVLEEMLPAGVGVRTGVVFPPAADVRELLPVLREVSLVVLCFPAFVDGRPFSQARELRGSLGYGGGLRARGRLIPDQAVFLYECGFDEIEVDPERFAAWTRAGGGLRYQSGVAGGVRRGVREARHGR